MDSSGGKNETNESDSRHLFAQTNYGDILLRSDLQCTLLLLIIRQSLRFFVRKWMGRLSGGVRAGFVLGAKGTKPQLSLPLPLWSHVNSTLAEIAN